MSRRSRFAGGLAFPRRRGGCLRRPGGWPLNGRPTLLRRVSLLRRRDQPRPSGHRRRMLGRGRDVRA
ncbi:MAG TPA: hypothetical protein VGS12_00135, partial [Caulobacteraceae bacterium]|nr:hypothetical protein [Caulobacteraceae bacterium]